MAIEEELELNIEKALEAVEQFAAQFEQAIASFSNTLAESLSAIFASPQVLQAELEINPGDSGEVVQDAIGNEQTTSVTFEDTNASDVGAEVQSELSSTVPPPISLPLEGEDAGLSDVVTDALTPEVQDVVLPVEADLVNGEEEAQSLEDYFANIDAMVTPTVDLSEVESAADQIQATDAEFPLFVDEGAVDNLEKVGPAAEAAGAGAKKAEEDVSQLEKVLAGVGVAAFAAGTALTAAFAVASGLFQSSVAAEGVLVGFNKQLGDLAPGIRDIDVQGLNIDLAELAQRVGSSDEAVFQVAQRFALLGQTSGATNEVIAEANSNLFGVATAIRTVNPSMGELDEIASKLTTGFQRGGTALARLGVNITSAEIRFRAASDAGKSTSDELTRFELASAGAAIAAEKFGSSIQSNFDDALENPQIALERLKEVFGDTLEVIGAPLVSPFLKIIEQGTPIVTNLISVIADLAIAFTPAIDIVVDALSELGGGLGGTSDSIIERFVPSFMNLADATVSLISAFDDLLPALTAIGAFFLSGIADLLEAFSASVAFFADNLYLGAAAALFFYAQIKSAFETLYLLLLANPWAAAAAGIFVVVTALNRLSDSASVSAPVFEDLREELFESVSTIEDLAQAVSQYVRGLDEYLTKTKILENASLVSTLNELGLSAGEFVGFLLEGEEGMRSLIRLLMGQGVEFQTFDNMGIAVKVASEDLDALSGMLLTAVFESTVATRGLGFAYEDLSGSIKSTSQAILERSAAEGTLPAVAVQSARMLAELQGETNNYTLILELATAQAEAMAQAQKNLEDANGTTAASNKEFAEATSLLAAEIAAGTAGADDLARAFEITGFSAEVLEEAVTAITEELDSFVAAAVEKVPSVAEAFSALNDETSAQQIIANFDEQIAATETWNANMLRLRDQGQTDILRLVAELGPEQGNLLLSQYQGNEQALAEHLKRMYQAEQDAKLAVREVAVLSWLDLRGVTGTAAEAVVAELRGKLTLADATEEAIIAASDAVAASSPVLAAELAEGVTGNVDALIVTSAEELTAKGAELNDAIGAVWNGAGGVAESASKVASEKAVLVFNSVIRGGFLDAETVQAVVDRSSSAMSDAGLFAGSAFATGVIMGMVTNAPSVNRMGEAVALGLGNSSTDNFDSAGTLLGDTLMDAVRDEIVASAGEVQAFLRAVLEGAGFAVAVVTAYSVGNNIGTSLVDGLADGIARNSFRAIQNVRDLISRANTAAKAEAESDSPSKVWERLGRDLVAGLSNGLDSASYLASNSAANVLGSANSSAGSVTNSNISITVPVTVTGNADASVGRQIGQIAAAELRSVLRLEARVA